MERNILDLAAGRTSHRRFKQEPVEFDDLLYALEAARQAPSGANRQPWRFIIVEDPKVKEDLREVCETIEFSYHRTVPEWMKEWMAKRGITYKKPFLTEAPYLVGVISKSDEPYAKESVWLAIGFVLLALEQVGLGTFTYTPSETKLVEKVLRVPEGYRLETILPIGRPVEKRVKERKTLNDLTFHDHWGVKF